MREATWGERKPVVEAHKALNGLFEMTVCSSADTTPHAGQIDGRELVCCVHAMPKKSRIIAVWPAPAQA